MLPPPPPLLAALDAARPGIAALVGAWPWLLTPLLVLWRTRGSRSLDDDDGDAPGTIHDAATTPLLSVVVPARDEARAIGACVRSLLATDHPAVEIVIVDDGSTDGTGDIARTAAAGDPRLTILRSPPLPDGWMGKQWACATGAAATRGTVLCFVDADTIHSPDLLRRATRALTRRDAALLSVVGRQELGSFWERLVQPQILAILAARYGSTERIARSRRREDKIANGQCVLVRREAYDAIGGHGAVRAAVSEDLALAQRIFASGQEIAIVLGTRQLSTRMYTSLGELIRGWRKNIYAGGIGALPERSPLRWLFPLMLLVPPALLLVPTIALLGAALGVAHPRTGEWAAVAWVASALGCSVAYARAGVPRAYALLHPVGGTVLLVIIVQAIIRGRRVEWKGREYRSA